MVATINNTVFYSIARYPNLDWSLQALKTTAEYFQVSIIFPIYDSEAYVSHTQHKFVDMIPFLEQWQKDGKEYVMFVDARDVVFVDTADNILSAYNEMNVDGILFNADAWDTVWPCKSHNFSSRVIQNVGGDGIANSGVFIGRIIDVLKLFYTSVEVCEYLRKQDYSHPLLNDLSYDDICCIEDPTYNPFGHGLYYNDQFCVQLHQYHNDPLIKVDVNKELLAWFQWDYPSIDKTQGVLVHNDIHIGTAKVLHNSRQKDQCFWNYWAETIVQKERDKEGGAISLKKLPNSFPIITNQQSSTNRKDITLVTRIRNRNHVLIQTLPNWLQFDLPIIVVDFRDDSCEKAWDVIQELKSTYDISKVTVIETVQEYMFNHSLSRNLGASMINTDYMLQIDVDHILDKDFFEINKPDASQFAHPILQPDTYHIFGLCLCTKQQFDEVNGYNENLIYAQQEDLDFYNRLSQTGYTWLEIPEKYVTHLDHDWDTRAKPYTKDHTPLTQLRNKQSIIQLYNYINKQLIRLLPWTDSSPRVQWHLDNLESNRHLATRNIHE